MSKKSSTVHLESSTWDEIDKYREEAGCSRNEAIERMFTERRLLLKLNCIPGAAKELAIEKEVQKNKNENEILKGAVNSTYDDMPD
ncbi:ribbon-helix-helix protein, CopG family [Clostridium paraputrificum]|uniref:ribbon-helix-helix protein, CopG family n=1 Tax=Clostridium paraputrificum TaxID=29363 RepID=UPI0023311C25|nr:ribbon-helix-helix protein, CopG family [Clostridium paraputrificum]MDB2122159.1 ribbon-helix-helix protein, CopG family [Clostridium paraputrificum]